MGGVRLKGITWEHRRAIDPLLAAARPFARAHPGIEIEWSSRPLHGFEFTPVAELAAAYDLIILDHPFCGDIALSGCLLPLDDVLAAVEDRAFVGPSLSSYRYDEHLWAVPVDAACQVAVSRPDLMARLGRPAPADWSALLALGRAARVEGMSLAIGLRGVHALMTFFTLCANLGRPCGLVPEGPFADRETALEALAHLRDLVALCPPECLDWNSIALHEAMAERDDLVFCPAVYCYATYAEGDRQRPLAFHDLPGPKGARGSTIGGTGLGVSASRPNPEAALAFARHAASAPAQFDFARHHGQPALAAVWEDEAVNARFGGCYRATRRTIEESWIRPRCPGYLRFQAEGGELMERHLRGGIGEAELLARLERLHAAGTRPH